MARDGAQDVAVTMEGDVVKYDVAPVAESKRQLQRTGSDASSAGWMGVACPPPLPKAKATKVTPKKKARASRSQAAAASPSGSVPPSERVAAPSYSFKRSSSASTLEGAASGVKVCPSVQGRELNSVQAILAKATALLESVGNHAGLKSLATDKVDAMLLQVEKKATTTKYTKLRYVSGQSSNDHQELKAARAADDLTNCLHKLKACRSVVASLTAESSSLKWDPAALEEALAECDLASLTLSTWARSVLMCRSIETNFSPEEPAPLIARPSLQPKLDQQFGLALVAECDRKAVQVDVVATLLRPLFDDGSDEGVNQLVACLSKLAPFDWICFAEGRQYFAAHQSLVDVIQGVADGTMVHGRAMELHTQAKRELAKESCEFDSQNRAGAHALIAKAKDAVDNSMRDNVSASDLAAAEKAAQDGGLEI